MPRFLEDTIPECPACLKIFPTAQGLNAHLAMAKSCKWYRKGKNRELTLIEQLPASAFPVDSMEVDPFDDTGLDNPLTWPPSLSDTNDDIDIDPSNDIERNEFLLLPQEGHTPAAAGPGPSTQAARDSQHSKIPHYRALDDEDDARIVIEHPTAGRIISHHSGYEGDGDAAMEDGTQQESPYLPFISELDWRVAEWATKDGPGQKAFDRFLAIPGITEKLGLSFHNVRSMHQKLDSLPNRAGEWKTKDLFFNDRPQEKFRIRYRDPIEAIRSLFSDPANADHLVYSPKKIYSNKSKESRIFSEMWTGKWWHILQHKLPEGATVAPIIIATDKTQLTQFSGGKAAYPVYLTIGNLPKSMRRKPSKNACILIGYLSVDKPSALGLSELEYRSRVQRIFHQSMKIILEPLKRAGEEGVLIESSNGDVRRVYPILTSYVTDYPEQCLVTCSKYGTCPKCQRPANDLQNPTKGQKRTKNWTESILTDAAANAEGNLSAFSKECMAKDVTGGVFMPFWKDFPYTDIHQCITPDILHQLYQGVFKHLVAWCQSCLGAKELDKRIRALPLGYGLQRFKNGISALSQISGSERKNMAKILLGCLVDKMSTSGIKAVKALLDFIYLAQYLTHSTETLDYLKTALQNFHKHKQFFINVECRTHFNLPKIHSLLHYIDSIELFGTTDNYNTEMFERLHIDFAKHGWRATNQRDEFPQMVQWLSRQEKVVYLNNLIASRQPPTPTNPQSHLRNIPRSIAKFPNYPRRPISIIEQLHKAPYFSYHLKQYFHSFLNRGSVSHRALDSTPLPISHVDVYNMFQFHPVSIQDDEQEYDIVKAIPVSKSLPEGRFDTVIVIDKDEAESTGMEGMRVGRVKVIFSLPKSIDGPGSQTQAPSSWPKTPLAYVEWYTRQATIADEKHGMYKISKATDNQGRIQGAIIPLSSIRQSCMLFPFFKDYKDELNSDTLNSSNVLDKCSSFLINNWLNHYSYQTIY